MTNLDKTESLRLPVLVLLLWLAMPGQAWEMPVPGDETPGDNNPGLTPDTSLEVQAARAATPLPVMVSPRGHSLVIGSLKAEVAVERSVPLPDFRGIQEVRTRKLRFFGFLLPLVQSENQRLSLIRRRLDFIHDHVRFQRVVPHEDRLWMLGIAWEFGLGTPDPGDPDFWRLVRLRVDTVPEELVLVQAAMESGWGTSRFAREGNNLFGQWCFCPGCGIVPQERPDGHAYEVASFESVNESVASYMRNLNTGWAYRNLREIRERMRRDGRLPDPAAIAEGLQSYSKRGPAYVQEIRSMLRHNAEVIDEARALLVDAG